MIQGQCSRRLLWALIVTKILQLQGAKFPRTPWTLCIHNFQAIIIISFLTSGTVSMSLYAVVSLKVVGGGGAKSSVNLVMGSWHPCMYEYEIHCAYRYLRHDAFFGISSPEHPSHTETCKYIFLIDFWALNTICNFYLSQINTFGDMMHSFPSFPL